MLTIGRLLSGLICLILITGCGPAATHTGAAKAQLQSAGQVVPGEIIVQFREGTSQNRIETILAATGTRIKKNLGAPLIYLLSISGDRSADETIRQFMSFAEVLHAEPNRITRMEPSLTPPSGNRKPDEVEKNLQ